MLRDRAIIERHIREFGSLLLVCASSWLSGCLLLAKSPVTGSGDCVDEDIDSRIGPHLAIIDTKDGKTESGCYEDTVELVEDAIVVAWTAPATGSYRFTATGNGFDLRLGVERYACGGISVCTPISRDWAATSKELDAGDTVYIKVATTAGLSGEVSFSVGLAEDTGEPSDSSDSGAAESSSDGGSSEGSCAWENDGYCDVTFGNCAPGTDVADCTCRYQGDLECDEPDLCPLGSDVADCDWS